MIVEASNKRAPLTYVFELNRGNFKICLYFLASSKPKSNFVSQIIMPLVSAYSAAAV